MAPWWQILIQVIIAIAQVFNRQPAFKAPRAKHERYAKRKDQLERISNIMREK